jgi:outer membrane protein assembly factor BamB
VLGIAGLAVLLSACWPVPGAGPDRRSSNPHERTLTPATVGRLTEAFRVSLPDGTGAPVVTPAGLFVRTGASIAAFEPGSGAPRWSVEAAGSAGPYASDPYVIDGDRVMASTRLEAEIVWADAITLDTGTGELLGSVSVLSDLTSLRGEEMATITPPTGQTGRPPVLTVRRIDGAQYWGGAAPEIDGGTGSLGADRQLYVGTTDRVQRYDATTPCPSDSPGSSVPICSSLWTRPVGGTVTPVVIGDDDTVFAGSVDGSLYALRADTGGIRWTASLGSPVTRAPALADGVLHVATADGRLSAISAEGCDTFRCPVVWTTVFGSEVTVQPVVAGGVVYVGSADGSLKAFDAAGCGADTCRALWTVNVGAPVQGGLAVHNGRLYVGTASALVSYGLPPA